VLTRRQLIARAGTAAAGWQLSHLGAARAAGPPIRLIVFPLLNGADHRMFWPNPGNLSAMSLVTEPLAPYQSQLTFVRGIDVTGSFNHMAVRSMFTGAAVPDYLSPDPTVKSVDQVMADHVAATGATPLRSLHLGVIPADSIQLYQMYGRSTFFFAPRPVDYEANPVSAFDRTFRGGSAPPGPAPGPTTPGGPAPAAPTSFENDVLDIEEAELTDLGKRVGASAREMAKLEQHRQAVRALRPAPVAGGSAPAPMAPPNPMAPPAAMPTPGLPGACGAGGSTLASVEKLRAALQGKDREAYKHQYYSDIFDAQIDILARAVTCGLTRVATIQAGSADGNVTDPVGPGYPHHNTSHGNQDIFGRCQQWYMTKFFRLLKALDVPDPLDAGKTVLHNSLVLLMSECMPVGHESNSVPVILAGRAGGALKSGSYVDLKSASNKTLMQTVLQLCGAGSAPHFGGGTFGELRA
jgi:hypothetical protein